MNTLLRITVVVCVAIEVQACAPARRVAELIDIFPTPRSAPKTIDVVCDSGGGSGACTADSLRSLLTQLCPSLSPGSVVRLHGMTDAVADVREIARFEITAPAKKTRRAVSGHRSRETAALVDRFVAAARPLFDGRRRSSPVAETIGRALLAGPVHGSEHEIFVLTDARQVSATSPALGKLDYECGNILPAEEFAPRLDKLYGAGALRGVNVHFCFVQLEQVEHQRCEATNERYVELKASWTGALSRLGAKVTWSMGTP